MTDINYDRAAADLDSVDCPWADEVYDYSSKAGFDSFMRENGLDPSKYYKDNGSNSGSSSSGSGCYLTTACVTAKDLPDDCEELTVLRDFRDTYLCNREGGREDIVHYYKTAPRIVEKINAGTNAQAIWENLYETLVQPCVSDIKAGEFEKAYEKYKACALELENEYIPKMGV